MVLFSTNPLIRANTLWHLFGQPISSQICRSKLGSQQQGWLSGCWNRLGLYHGHDWARHVTLCSAALADSALLLCDVWFCDVRCKVVVCSCRTALLQSANRMPVYLSELQ